MIEKDVYTLWNFGSQWAKIFFMVEFICKLLIYGLVMVKILKNKIL